MEVRPNMTIRETYNKEAEAYARCFSRKVFFFGEFPKVPDTIVTMPREEREELDKLLTEDCNGSSSTSSQKIKEKLNDFEEEKVHVQEDDDGDVLSKNQHENLSNKSSEKKKKKKNVAKWQSDTDAINSSPLNLTNYQISEHDEKQEKKANEKSHGDAVGETLQNKNVFANDRRDSSMKPVLRSEPAVVSVSMEKSKGSVNGTSHDSVNAKHSSFYDKLNPLCDNVLLNVKKKKSNQVDLEKNVELTKSGEESKKKKGDRNGDLLPFPQSFAPGSQPSQHLNCANEYSECSSNGLEEFVQDMLFLEVAEVPKSSEDNNFHQDSLRNESKLQRSSSLKTTKISSGVSGSKKIVRFADALGLDLIDVRTFLDDIPKIPTSAYQDLRFDEKTPLERVSSSLTLVPLFQQPGHQMDFLQRVHHQNICLEKALVSDAGVLAVACFVRVRNLDYHKSVHVRYSLNNWKTFSDVKASYIPHSCDGFTDKFSFVIYGHTLRKGDKIEFALRLECLGNQYWDNNGGINYAFNCLPESCSNSFFSSKSIQ